MGRVRRFMHPMTRAVAFAFCVCFWLSQGHAQAQGQSAAGGAVPELGPMPALGSLAGRQVSRIKIVTRGRRWEKPVVLRRARVGDYLTGELARRAMSELLDSGRYADVRAEADADG